MAKTYLGIDIGHNQLKLALVAGNAVKKTASVTMPMNLVREGHITSTETFGELLAKAMKEEKMRANLGAVVLSSGVCYLRSTTMPVMTPDQLMINLPYEFSDYITGELNDYLYDYAVLPPAEGEEVEEGKLSLLTAAVEKTALDELRDALRKAGLQLAKAAPAECACIGLIRAYEERTGTHDGDYCFVDLGSRAIRMFIFHGTRHLATRILEIGLNTLDQIIADAKGIDPYLAHTHLVTNFEDCQNEDYCKSAYDNIAVELMRALNFFRFSNNGSTINRIYLSGGGARIAALRQVIVDTVGIEVCNASEMIADDEQDGFEYAFAVGAALN